MTPVWDVAPDPEATNRETPGNFREHDIRPFAAGMTPPSWPLVPAQLQEWINDVCATGQKIRAGTELDRPLVEELARLHNFSLPALRQAAQRGRLDAVHGPDGIWRNSRKAVDAYRLARHRRRPNHA